MKKTDIEIMPEYFDRYINLCDNLDVLEALSNYGPNLILPILEALNQINQKTYLPKKWTIHDILQHVIDTERIFAYRALRFARNDQTPLAGFDENAYSLKTLASKREIKDLLLEFEYVRQSNISLFKSFTNTQFLATGISNGKSCSVLALGFIIAGHWLHHLQVINERYLPLAAE